VGLEPQIDTTAAGTPVATGTNDDPSQWRMAPAPPPIQAAVSLDAQMLSQSGSPGAP
jgi:hypothetical protein